MPATWKAGSRKRGRRRYKSALRGTLALQAVSRGCLARQAVIDLRSRLHRSQALARGWLQRRAFAQLLLAHCSALAEELMADERADVRECLFFIERRGEMPGLEHETIGLWSGHKSNIGLRAPIGILLIN